MLYYSKKGTDWVKGAIAPLALSPACTCYNYLTSLHLVSTITKLFCNKPLSLFVLQKILIIIVQYEHMGKICCFFIKDLKIFKLRHIL